MCKISGPGSGWLPGPFPFTHHVDQLTWDTPQFGTEGGGAVEGQITQVDAQTNRVVGGLWIVARP